jgi:hypothetical protein
LTATLPLNMTTRRALIIPAGLVRHPPIPDHHPNDQAIPQGQEGLQVALFHPRDLRRRPHHYSFVPTSRSHLSSSESVRTGLSEDTWAYKPTRFLASAHVTVLASHFGWDKRGLQVLGAIQGLGGSSGSIGFPLRRGTIRYVNDTVRSFPLPLLTPRYSCRLFFLSLSLLSEGKRLLIVIGVLFF